MTFATKTWQDSPATTTPISAAALIDLETRLSGYTDSAVFALTDASTIAIDAATHSKFRVTFAGNRTLGNPTNAFDGQMIQIAVTQDGTGSRTITFGTKYKFGTDLTSVVLSTGAGVTDLLALRYDSVQDKFWVVSFLRGF